MFWNPVPIHPLSLSVEIPTINWRMSTDRNIKRLVWWRYSVYEGLMFRLLTGPSSVCEAQFNSLVK